MWLFSFMGSGPTLKVFYSDVLKLGSQVFISDPRSLAQPMDAFASMSQAQMRNVKYSYRRALNCQPGASTRKRSTSSD